MSTLVTRSIPQGPALPVANILSRIASALRATADVFAEAQDLARAAHARYPFTEW